MSTENSQQEKQIDKGIGEECLKEMEEQAKIVDNLYTSAVLLSLPVILSLVYIGRRTPTLFWLYIMVIIFTIFILRCVEIEVRYLISKCKIKDKIIEKKVDNSIHASPPFSTIILYRKKMLKLIANIFCILSFVGMVLTLGSTTANLSNSYNIIASPYHLFEEFFINAEIMTVTYVSDSTYYSIESEDNLSIRYLVNFQTDTGEIISVSSSEDRSGKDIEELRKYDDMQITYYPHTGEYAL